MAVVIGILTNELAIIIPTANAPYREKIVASAIRSTTPGSTGTPKRLKASTIPNRATITVRNRFRTVTTDSTSIPNTAPTENMDSIRPYCRALNPRSNRSTLGNNT